MGNLKLGITSIGDLLINNKITETDDGNSLDNIVLQIPPYQRPYKWTAKNAGQLLDDIENAMIENKEVYRVGTLILHHNGDSYDIVDGQQRTITFALLLSCCDAGGMNFLDQNLAKNEYNLHNVKNNYRAFQRRIEKIEDDTDKEKLKDYISERCEIIVVITEDLSEAFQFFDSQNARGKSLYPHDLLKAYHLREMDDFDLSDVEKVVKTWEELDQKKLAVLFNDYLYRLKEWINGNRPDELNEKNIELFKGIDSKDTHPYAQYYKGAFAFADDLNKSKVPFVTGIQKLSPFQLNTPVIAGKPFFEYTKHYFDILADIQNNDRYEGYFINDNEIVKTLDTRKYKNGVGNRITRLMFDTAVLLYVDRFCPAVPAKPDVDYLNQFVIYAFIWAYSMRAQYKNVGWLVAQNYVMGTSNRDGLVNSFNIYKVISEAYSPSTLLSRLADLVTPLSMDKVVVDTSVDFDKKEDGVYEYYLHYFKVNRFLEGR